jgi:hypothetical protein
MEKGPRRADRPDGVPPRRGAYSALKKIVAVARHEMAGNVIVPRAVEGMTPDEQDYASLYSTMTVVLGPNDKPLLSVRAQQLVRVLLQENERLETLLRQQDPPSRHEMEREGKRARHACRVLASELTTCIEVPRGYTLIWEKENHQQMEVAMQIIEDVFYDINAVPLEGADNPINSLPPVEQRPNNPH